MPAGRAAPRPHAPLSAPGRAQELSKEETAKVAKDAKQAQRKAWGREEVGIRINLAQRQSSAEVGAETEPAAEADPVVAGAAGC